MYDVTASVIVPCRNSADTLETALAGPLSSPLRELEVIAVDDGSTDNSAEIIDDYAKKDARILPIHKKNGGVSDNDTPPFL